MTKLFYIIKGEFYRYFISPLAYVYLICFLLLNSSFALYFGGIFTSGNASLLPMFNFLPWILLLFIPGIAMRLWAEEFKSGTVLQIMTLPVSVSSFVWGKFLAAWAFCSLAILLTFPFVITLNILGSPDNWVIFNSYFGAILLSGAMLAISQTASALSKNQVVALVISVIINLLFFLSGLEYVLGFFRGFAPAYIVDMISSFSFLTHVANFNLGILETRDLVFFVSLIIMFNFFTSTIICFKTSGTFPFLKSSSSFGAFLGVALIFLSFIGINLFAGNLLRLPRIDFTQEQLFTPSQSTIKILQNLPSPVTAKVYYSPILGKRDEQMRLSFDNLRLLLQSYQRISDGRFSYRIYNPEPLSDAEDRALQAGIQPLPISDLNAAAYFGIVLVNENGQTRTIPFMPLARQNLLEQDLTENILLLEHQKKKLGLYTSLPLLGSAQNGVVIQPWQITEEIEKYYNIIEIKSPDDLKDLDVLLIAYPQEMPQSMEEAIYNYSITGGKILAFFDIAPEALKLAGPQTSLLRPSDYGNLPQKWGFRFYNDLVVTDLDNSSEVSIETADYSGTTQDLVQFYLTSNSFVPNLPETTGLKRMLITSASVFYPLKDADIYFIPLLIPSQHSALTSSAVVTQSLHPAEILRRFQADTTPKYLAAHILGKNATHPLDLIVVGDSDLLYDSFWTTSATIGNKNYNIPLLDNGNFVLNSLDVLIGDDTMLSLRGKSRQLRPFTKLEQEQKQILRQYKIKEKDIFDQITLIKKGLDEIWNKKDFEGRENFTPDELSVLTKVKKQLEQKRQELFSIRLDLNRNLEHTEFLVKLFNIYTIPGLIILGILMFNLPRLKLKPLPSIVFNRRLALLSVLALGCIALGLGSIYFLPERKLPQYEGKPLFPDITRQINSINQITLASHDQELNIVKNNNLWELKDYPCFLVNQNRIKSFLSALVQATIYEKKSDKLENLPRFGLLPLTNPESTATSVCLKNSLGETLLSFDVGKYNIDLSRGSLGAYIRFPDQFQIWLAAIELVDLDMDYHYWSYASLWNLQFGRFSQINDNSDPDYVASLVSIFLNTKLFPAQDITSPTQLFSISADGESFQNLVFAFYEQDEKYYVKFIFDAIKDNSYLKAFADKTASAYYQILPSDLEKIRHAFNPRPNK